MNFNELYPKKKEYYYLLMNIKTIAECNVSNCVIDKQKAKLLMRYINKKEKETERLNNIIEEVREYIESYNLEYLHETNEHNLADILEELLEILDKGGIK